MPETHQAPSTKTWDGAASPGAAGYVRRFETAWKSSTAPARPSPRAFAPDEPNERPAILLALLRSEIGLRWDVGDRATAETYRQEYPELDPDGLVALIYEEFCLREDAGEAPTPVEYDERFPELAARLRRVFDIHELVGSGGSAAFRAAVSCEAPFPESGQTIAGFRLIEELGRGSFARVFLAEERQLADRPVALKVSRTGSREPQTLARLQHTHIVPVHSYRIDPATSLHLLCMPFFGRVTLERLLAAPGVKKACWGSDVLVALDRLEPSGGSEGVAARSVFARLPFARAIAWWGARLAEALAHAHERGVLHRDVKPSNVLVTADGLPMLLDFNLARDPCAEAEGAAMGGTLAYMAPEHLDALAAGHDGGVDQRADVYSLGVLLFEVLTGRRPFSIPTGARSVADALRGAAEERRRATLSIRATHPEVPSGMEAVVLKCLAFDPARRYANAAALAADLQAVADDGPLRHAREPIVSRSVRWSRRHRWPIALAGLVAIAWGVLANAVVGAREDQRRVVAILAAWIDEAERLAEAGRFAQASVKLADAASLAAGMPDFARQPPLVARRDLALARLGEVTLAGNLDATAERLRLLLPTARDEAREASRAIDAAIAPWMSMEPERQPGYRLRARLKDELEELLFLRTLLDARSRLLDPREGLARLTEAERFAGDPAPWLSLRDWLAGSPERVAAPAPSDSLDAQACLLNGLLADAQGRTQPALAWVKRAARLAPDRPGLDATLARLAASAGNVAEALEFAAKARRRSPGLAGDRARSE